MWVEIIEKAWVFKVLEYPGNWAPVLFWRGCSPEGLARFLWMNY